MGKGRKRRYDEGVGKFTSNWGSEVNNGEIKETRKETCHSDVTLSCMPMIQNNCPCYSDIQCTRKYMESCLIESVQ